MTDICIVWMNLNSHCSTLLCSSDTSLKKQKTKGIQLKTLNWKKVSSFSFWTSQGYKSCVCEDKQHNLLSVKKVKGCEQKRKKIRITIT